MTNANLVSARIGRRSWLLLVAAVALMLGGCGGGKPPTAVSPAPAAGPAPKTIADWFAIKVGPETVRMQLAVTDPEMEHGLMQRRDLAPDQGMIFIYDHSQRMTFWMKNTPTPLDIGYFTSDGLLHEVWPMYAFDETTVASRSNQIQFCLEMNLGWYKAHNLMPGAQLDLGALAAAMRERGFNPAKFGLK